MTVCEIIALPITEDISHLMGCRQAALTSQATGFTFLSAGPKTVRKISVTTLILFEIHHIAFTNAFMVTAWSPFDYISHTNVVQHSGVDSNKLTYIGIYMSNPAIPRPVSS